MELSPPRAESELRGRRLRLRQRCSRHLFWGERSAKNDSAIATIIAPMPRAAFTQQETAVSSDTETATPLTLPRLRRCVVWMTLVLGRAGSSGFSPFALECCGGDDDTVWDGCTNERRLCMCECYDVWNRVYVT